jgi:MOSC domain-containing protein YiiM
VSAVTDKVGFSTRSFKHSVQKEVGIDTAGLASDTVADTIRHAGSDQAVYLSVEDYACWTTELQ